MASWSAPKSKWRGWKPPTAQLSERLETRKLLERAKGILQRDMGLTEEQAYLTLQQQSRQTRKSMKQIAEAIILSDEVKRSSKIAS